MSEKRRLLPRIGLVFLNVLVPGLGILRLGRWRLAALLYGLALAVLLFFRFGPLAPFWVWALAISVAIVVLIVSFVATWRFGRIKEVQRPVWSRWYVILAAIVLVFGINLLLLDQDKIAYRNFYLPAESMAPTLVKGDRLVAYMRTPNKLRRGDVLLVRAPGGEIYVKRLIGLPGDLIAVVNGVVQLNGSPVEQKLVSTEQVKDAFEIVTARKLGEQFAGERQQHQIYDYGRSIGDNFGPVSVRPGHYFLMGDNRDRSADSRFGSDVYGLGQVAYSDVVGEALFYSWGSSRPIGTPIASP